MHYHGYSWIGQGDDMRDESTRRPAGEGGSGFEAGDMPPVVVSWWLLRPARQIRGTWDDVDGAVEWLTAEFGKVQQSLTHPDGVGLPKRVGYARRRLADGDSVVWEHWLTGGRKSNFTVVPCPQKGYRCPTA